MSLHRGLIAAFVVSGLAGCDPTPRDLDEEGRPAISFSQWWLGPLRFEEGGDFEGSGSLVMLVEAEDGDLSGQIELASGSFTFGGFSFPETGGLAIAGSAEWTDLRPSDWTEEPLFEEEHELGNCLVGEVRAPVAPAYEASFLTCVGSGSLFGEMDEEGASHWRMSTEADAFFVLER